MKKENTIALFLMSIGAFCTICSCSFLTSPEGIALEEELLKEAVDLAEEELSEPSKS